MSVLIKDMKMPISCIECPCSLNLFFCKVYDGKPIADASSITINGTTINVKRPDWCPIVEFSEHHGDLIDVNEILWDDHYDSDGNLSKYKIAYSDEMPDPIIKGEELSNERSN